MYSGLTADAIFWRGRWRWGSRGCLDAIAGASYSHPQSTVLLAAGMKLGFEEVQLGYTSGSQKARVWTEQWVSQQLYCPNCGNPRITQLPANLPVADFFCPKCNDQFELKSQKKDFGAKVADGAYHTKCERLVSSTNPNLLLLSYDLADAAVRNVSVVPKHFFVPDIVERRKPLAKTARRTDRQGHNDSAHAERSAEGLRLARQSYPPYRVSRLYVTRFGLTASGPSLRTLSAS